MEKNANNVAKPVVEKSFFDGKLIQLIGWFLLGNLLTTITLGICFPFALCFIEEWRIKHTVINGKRLCFNGNGAQLIGKWILWMFLSIITIGIYSLWIPIKIEKWKVEHTKFVD